MVTKSSQSLRSKVQHRFREFLSSYQKQAIGPKRKFVLHQRIVIRHQGKVVRHQRKVIRRQGKVVRQQGIAVRQQRIVFRCHGLGIFLPGRAEWERKILLRR